MILNEKFEIHDKLNPKLFTADNKLQPLVRSKILEIAQEFYDTLDVELPVIDIHLVGSNVSYNYTKDSDLDVHLIINFDLVEASQDIAQLFFNCKKTAFNSNYDINIKGIPVEVYVEDVQAATISNGIYSIGADDWIKFPTKITVKPIEPGENSLSLLVEKIRGVISKGELKMQRDLLNSLYNMRKNSLAVDGEYGRGNLLFKELRSMGLIDELRKAIYDSTSKELSLESLADNVSCGRYICTFDV